MNKNYAKSLLYFMLSLFVSSLNDTLSKYIITTGLSPIQVTWGRLFMGALLLLLYGLPTGKATLPIRYPHRHFLRGTLLGVASTLWVYSLFYVQVATATVMSFTIPLFVFLFSPLLLGKPASSRLWLPTIFTILGILLLLRPSLDATTTFWTPLALFIGVLLFALLDVLNKKYLHEQTLFSMIFYSALVAALLTTPFAYMEWTTPSSRQLIYLVFLGLGGNLIIYFLLKAYQNSDIVALAPIRYLELLISIVLSYFVFHDTPSKEQVYSALIIIPSVLFIIYDQARKKESKP